MEAQPCSRISVRSCDRNTDRTDRQSRLRPTFGCCGCSTNGTRWQIPLAQGRSRCETRSHARHRGAKGGQSTRDQACFRIIQPFTHLDPTHSPLTSCAYNAHNDLSVKRIRSAATQRRHWQRLRARQAVSRLATSDGRSAAAALPPAATPPRKRRGAGEKRDGNKALRAATAL